MSTSIDERIVKMTFENSNFESGVSSSLKWLDKLKASLNFKNSTNGLDDVSKNVNSLTNSGLGGLSQGIDAVTTRFSTLGIIATTALVNITNSALNAGKNLGNALTFEPILTGFQEYETKMTAIQTILTNTASKGTTLDDVTKALNELNLYADKTIYNFAEMTKNIGTFTAAGVDLETSVMAIKGIANLGAGSGSTPAQVATGMYQLSQALAAGQVTLADWNSVVNAGMGGELFQNALKKTAKQMGIVVDESVSFRESLSTKSGPSWLTSDVLLKTLSQFAEDKTLVQAATEVKTFTGLLDTMKESVQSGWAVSWEHILGDKNQAAELFTAMSNGFNNIIGPSSDARNEMLKFWNEAGGRDDVVKGLSTIVNSIGKGLGAIGEAFRDVFPAMTGKQLVDISAGFKDLSEKFKMSDETAGKIKDTFKGIFSVFNLVKKAVVGVVGALLPLTGIVGGLGGVFLTVSSGIGKFVSSINDAVVKSKFFDTISSSVSSALSSIGWAITNIDKLIGGIFEALTGLDFGPFLNSFGEVIKIFSTGFGSIFGGIGKALGSINFNTIFNAINTALAGGALVLLKDFIESFGDVTSDLTGVFSTIKGSFEGITETLDAVKDSLSAYQSNLNAGILLKISVAIGILATALLTLSTIDPAKMDTALTGITALFMELMASMAILIKITAGAKFKGFFQIPTMFISLAIALNILASAVRKLSDLSWDELARGLSGTVALMATLVAASKLVSTNSKGMIKMGASMILLSVAINNMAKAVEKLGGLKTDTIVKGISAIGAILLELAIFDKLNGANSTGIRNSAGIILLSLALNALAMAVSSFGNMKVDAMIQGISGIGALLLQLSIFSKLIGKSGNMIGVSTGLIILGVALNILSTSISSMGNMQWDQMGRGLTAMASSLTIIAVAARMLPKGLIVSAAGVGAMGLALNVLGSALSKLGNQSWQEVGISLVSLAGSLVIIAAAMKLMSTGIGGAAAMLVMSAALALFVPQLLLLSNLDISQVGIGLLALAGAFTVLGIAGLALAPVLPALIGLAGVIALLGLSTLAVAASLSMFAASLGLLVAVGSAGGFALAEILRQLLGLLPLFGKKLGEGIVNFADTIGNLMPTLIEAFGKMISGLLTALATAIPQIVETAVKLVTALVKAIGDAAPLLLDAGINVLIKLLEGISKNIERITTVAVDVIIKFVNTIADNLGRIINAGIELAISFINGVANGLRDNGPELNAAMSNLISALFEVALGLILAGVGSFVDGGIKLLNGLLDGMLSMIGQIISFVASIPGKIVSAISTGVSSMYNVGSNLIRGLINGVKDKAKDVVTAAKGVVNNAITAAKNLLGINSPSRVFAEIGKFTAQGLAVGLTKYSKVGIAPAEELAQKAIDAATSPLSKISSILSGEIETNPTIKPVVDLSDVKNGARTISDLLTNNSKLALSPNTSGIMSKTIGKIQNGVDNSDVVSALKDLKESLTSTPNNSYNVNGITYDDGSNISSAIKTLVHATTIERRV